MIRRALGLSALIGLIATSGCAPLAPYQGPRPAPGAIRAFDAPPSEADPAWWVAGTAEPARHHLGTLAVPADRDSLVLIVYGDNRPGQRMITTPWGVNAIKSGFATPSVTGWAWGLLNVPVALVQAVVPTLDGFQDLASATLTHRYTGGAEKQVRRAIERALPADLIVHTGDVVKEGRRGRHWDDFANQHSALRDRVPMVASVGNHEETWDPVARDNWNAVMGEPARPGRYWFSLDLPDRAARVIVLDGTILTDHKGRYPDSLRAALSEEQLAWADQALATEARLKLVIVHYPLVTTGRHLSDWASDAHPERGYRARMLESFRAHGVTAVFTGHEHLYQSVYVTHEAVERGFWHVTTGGGGSPLYHVDDRLRETIRSQPLPDASKVHWPAEERSVYHFCRLVVPRRETGAARMTVHQVRKNGEVSVIDAYDITAPMGRDGS